MRPRFNLMLTIRQPFFHDDVPKEEKKGWYFFTAKEAAENGILPTAGRQNKHHGRQPGSYKRKRDMVRKSRRANRSVK